MKQVDMNLKEFLEEQLRWSIEQGYILEQMSALLYQLRELAEIAINQQLKNYQREKLNEELIELKVQYNSIESQLNPVFH